MSSTGHLKAIVSNAIIVAPSRAVTDVLRSFSLKRSIMNKQIHLGNTIHTGCSQNSSTMLRDRLLLVTVIGVSLVVVHWLNPTNAGVFPKLSQSELDRRRSGRDNLKSTIGKRTSSFITSLGNSTRRISNTLLREIGGKRSDRRVCRRVGGVNSSSHRVITRIVSRGTNSPNTLFSFSISRTSRGRESSEEIIASSKVHVGTAGRRTLSDSAVVLREDPIVGRVSGCASSAGATVLNKKVSKTTWLNKLTVAPGAFAFDLGSLTPERDFIGGAESTISSFSTVASMTDGVASLLTAALGGVNIDTDIPHASIATVGIVGSRGFLHAEAQTTALGIAIVHRARQNGDGSNEGSCKPEPQGVHGSFQQVQLNTKFKITINSIKLSKCVTYVRYLRRLALAWKEILWRRWEHLSSSSTCGSRFDHNNRARRRRMIFSCFAVIKKGTGLSLEREDPEVTSTIS